MPLAVNDRLTFLFLFCPLCPRQLLGVCHGPDCQAKQLTGGHAGQRGGRSIAHHKGDVRKALKEMMVLNAHVNDQLERI
jgi:hypothetical protein